MLLGLWSGVRFVGVVICILRTWPVHVHDGSFVGFLVYCLVCYENCLGNSCFGSCCCC